MGSPAIFSGRRTKLLTADGLQTSAGAVIDNDGVKNFISNGHAQVDTAGWVTYASAASPRPTTGVGGTPTLTFTRSNVSALSGQASFIYTSPGAVQGQGVSYDFYIDNKDRGKVLQISFDYMVNSGTFVAGSTGVDSDVIAYIYNAGDGVVVEPSNIKLLSSNTFLADKFTGTFQTSSTSRIYRLILHSATASAAFSLKIGNVTVSPSVYVYGSPVTDMGNNYVFTTGFTTNVAATASKNRRVGDNIHNITNISFNGANTQALNNINLPIPADSNKVPGGTIRTVLGQWFLRSGTAGTVGSGAVVLSPAGSGYGVVLMEGLSPSASIPFAITTNSELTAEFTYAPVGLSSSVQMSDGFDGRVIALSASISGTQSVATATATKIIWNTITNSFDKTNALNLTNGTITVQTAGVYAISGVVNVGASSLTFDADARLYIDGAFVKINNSSKSGTGATSHAVPFNFRQELRAGQTIEIYFAHAAGATVTVRGNGSAQDLTNLNIEKLSGSATTSATESVNLSYSSNAGQSFVNNTVTILSFPTRDYDTHGAWDGTSFRAPAVGKYRVSLTFQFAIATWNNVTRATVQLYKNGSLVGKGINSVYTGTAIGSYVVNMPGGSTEVSLLSGDILTLRLDQNSGATQAFLADSTLTHVEISKIG